MEYNKKKVNLIIFTLIILIAMVSIFATVNFIEEEKAPETDVIAENQISELENNDETNSVETTVELKKAPTFSSGWAAYYYAEKILKENDFVLTGTAVGTNDPIAGISLVQYVDEKLYKSGSDYFFIDKAHCDSSYGTNYTKYVYNDGTNVVSKYEGLKATTVSLSDFIKKNGRAPDFLYYTINSKTCTMDSFKISGASYILKITLNSTVPGVFDDMEKGLNNSPKKLQNAYGISATFEIKINRKTGAFESIKTTERYHIDLNSLLSSDITTVTTQTFTWKSVDVGSLVKKYIG